MNACGVSPPAWRSLALAGVALALGGCASIPADALRLAPDAPEKRALQTRAFPGAQEADLLAASAAVLQDLGFTLDESETKLGLVTASRKLTSRRPLNSSEVVSNLAGAALMPYIYGPYLAYNAVAGIKEPQIVRVTLVTTRPADGPERKAAVRVTAQRYVYVDERFAEVKSAEALDDPQFYREFFTRLEKSTFLEKQKNAL
jgi:hypothetical protein